MSAQALEALERANEVRMASAEYRRELRSQPREEAMREAARLLLDPPPAVQRMRIGLFLSSIRHVGPKKVARILQAAEVWTPNRFIGPDHRDRCGTVLTTRQRRVIAETLGGYRTRRSRRTM